MAPMIQTTADQWNQMAADIAKQLLEGPTIAPAEAMINTLNAAYPFSQATAIMDNGCGPGGPATGLLIQHYGTQLPKTARLIAADFSTGMIDQVRERQKKELAQGNKVWEKVETAIYDAQNLSGVEDGSLSHMMAGFMLFMVPEPRRALKEALRVLTPENGGGVLAATSWQGNEWIDLLDLIKVVRPDVTLANLPEAWSSVDAVRGELEATGFREVEVHAMQTYMQFDDPVTFVDFMVKRLPHMAKIREGMKPEEVDQACDLMVQHLKIKYPQMPGRMVGTAIVGVGRK